MLLRNQLWGGIVDVPRTVFADSAAASSRWSAKMTLRKRATGTRLQIPFKRQGAWLVGESDEEIEVPGPPISGMGTAPGIMRRQACRHIRCHARVVASGILRALQDIDAGLGIRHGDLWQQGTRPRSALKNRVQAAIASGGQLERLPSG